MGTMRKIEGQKHENSFELMEHHKSKGETEFLTRAGKL